MKIFLATKEAVKAFLSVMNAEPDTYYIESEDHNCRVNAKSMMGVLYATTECGYSFWLVNATHAGWYPNSVNSFGAAAL